MSRINDPPKAQALNLKCSHNDIRLVTAISGQDTAPVEDDDDYYYYWDDYYRRKLSSPSESVQAKLVSSRSIPGTSNPASGRLGEHADNKGPNPKRSSAPNPAALLDGWTRPPNWESLSVMHQTAVVQKYVTSKGLSLTVVPISQGSSSIDGHVDPSSLGKDTQRASVRSKKLASDHKLDARARSAWDSSPASPAWATSKKATVIAREPIGSNSTSTARIDGGSSSAAQSVSPGNTRIAVT